MNTFIPSAKDSKSLLSDVDEFAVANVIAGRGGPFGASLHVYTHDDAQYHQIGTLSANAVLETGTASAHAEDQMLSPEPYRKLKDFLRSLPTQQKRSVILCSSGESCPSCHSKIEIVSRDLIKEGLIDNDGFIVLYGATYQQTHDVAKFNDAPYLKDMQRETSQRQIQQRIVSIQDTPDEVKYAFTHADKATSVIQLCDNTFITEYEDRANDIIATSEVSAFRSAAQHQKAQGSDTPWDLQNAILYTSTSEIGPLGYSEALWANIGSWVTVSHDRQEQWSTTETDDISNSQFYSIVTTRPYNTTGAAISAIQVPDFLNKAQHEWRKKLDQTDDAILYNGADIRETQEK